jgi:hypothetical protein
MALERAGIDVRVLLETEWEAARLPPPLIKALRSLSAEWTVFAGKKSTHVEITDSYAPETVAQARAHVIENDDPIDIAQYTTHPDFHRYSKALFQLEQLLDDPAALERRNVPNTQATAGNDSPKPALSDSPAEPAIERSPINDTLRATFTASATAMELNEADTLKALDRWAIAVPSERMIHTREDMITAAFRAEAMAGTELPHGSTLFLADRFSDHARAISKAIRRNTATPHRKGSHTLSSEEQLHLKRTIHRVAADIEQLRTKLPAERSDNAPTLHELLDDAALISGGAAHVQSFLVEQLGKRLSNHPTVAKSIDETLQRIASRATEKADSATDADVRALLRTLSNIARTASPIPSPAAETSRHERVPLSPLGDALEHGGINLASSIEWFNERTEAHARLDEVAPSKNPSRVAVAKRLRALFPSTGKCIPFERARDFLAPAGIVAVQEMTEHPWYWTCTTPGFAGRHAITHDRAEHGFYHTEIIATLFGHNESHGIGDVDALIASFKNDDPSIA